MKIKTSELQPLALDWAVTTLENPEACKYGVEDWRDQRKHTVKNGEYVYRWHQSWAQSGPIIERNWIDLHCVNDSLWEAEINANDYHNRKNGPTPLIAAMRCYVASKLGDEVEIPLAGWGAGTGETSGPHRSASM